jgi:hypothetical protein
MLQLDEVAVEFDCGRKGPNEGNQPESVAGYALHMVADEHSTRIR